MSQLVDSYSSVKEQKSMLSTLILEKGVRNVTIPRVANTIKTVSKILVEHSIVKYHNIFKDLFVTSVTKFQITVGHFVLGLLNTMKKVLIRNDFLLVLEK